MKTVIDAVNEFKGEWKYIGDDAIYFRCHVGCKHYYYYGNDKPFNSEYVCSKAQFNDLVSQMETNFGKCCGSELVARQEGIKNPWNGSGYGKHINDLKSDKELEVMDIEDKFEFCDNSGTHTITSNNILCCADTGRVVAVFYNEHDLREATGLVKKVSLTDGNCYQFDYHTGANTTLDQVTGMYDDNGDCMWIKGNNYSVDLCTNIQPLTVEVK